MISSNRKNVEYSIVDMSSIRNVWISGSKLAGMLVQLVEPKVSSLSRRGYLADCLAVDKAQAKPTADQALGGEPIAPTTM